MAWIVLLAIIAIPVTEIAFFVKVAQAIGLVQAVATAILAGVIGLALLKHQGLATLTRARQALERGAVPMDDAFDGICLLLAGALLLLPGFISDILALVLLLPPVRALLRLWLARNARIHTVVVRDGEPRPAPPPPMIEGEYHEIREEDDDHRPR